MVSAAKNRRCVDQSNASVVMETRCVYCRMGVDGGGNAGRLDCVKRGCCKSSLLREAEDVTVKWWVEMHVTVAQEVWRQD